MNRPKTGCSFCPEMVVMMTSSNQDRDIADCYRFGVNGYVTKPGNTDALAAVVETIERFWITVAALPKATR